MIETEDIKKMVAHIIKRQQGVRDREVMDPNREWILGIGVTIFFVCLGGVVSYVLYLNTINLEIATSESAIVSVSYDNTLVESAVKKFQERAKAYNSISGNNSKPITTEEVSIENEETEVETVVDASEDEVNTVSSSTEDIPVVEEIDGEVQLDI